MADPQEAPCPDCGKPMTREQAKDLYAEGLQVGIDLWKPKADALAADLAAERETALNDPAEQRAERYALEAMDLTARLIAAESALAQAQAERDSLRLELAASEHNRMAGNAHLLAEAARIKEALAAMVKEINDYGWPTLETEALVNAALKEQP